MEGLGGGETLLMIQKLKRWDKEEIQQSSVKRKSRFK